MATALDLQLQPCFNFLTYKKRFNVRHHEPDHIQQFQRCALIGDIILLVLKEWPNLD